MTTRKIEIFSAGCVFCREAVDLAERLAGPGCTVTVSDMSDLEVARRARNLGVTRVPAVAIDGQVATCCLGGGLDEAALRSAGLGQCP